MKIVYHKDFIKSFKKLPKKIKEKFKDRQILFEEGEFDPILNNHALKGKWLGYRSINVTGDIRAIFKRGTESVLFVAIDNHSNLYD
jgi:addiction module RelE/StbE family toxin